jgi:hypothetical protein
MDEEEDDARKALLALAPIRIVALLGKDALAAIQRT